MKVLDIIFAPFKGDLKGKKSDFSQSNLFWMKIFGLLAIPGPVAYFLFVLYLHDFFDAQIVMAVVLVPVVAMFGCLFLKPVSHLSRTNKNLDEWEQGLKYRSESFAYRLIFYSGFVFSAFVVLVGFLNAEVSMKISKQVPLLDFGLILLVLPLTMSTVVINYLAWTVMPFAEDCDEDAMIAREKKVRDTILIVAIIISVLAIIPALFALGWVNAHQAAGHEGLF